jgi:hypothetical protein
MLPAACRRQAFCYDRLGSGMSQDIFKEIQELELVYDDGEPSDSNWHRIQMNLLIDVISQAMVERQKRDFFAGGNMFVYFDIEQAHSIATEPREKNPQFRGPDHCRTKGASPLPVNQTNRQHA